jgi:hypothetical protein
MKTSIQFLLIVLMSATVIAAPIKSNLASREISAMSSVSGPTAKDYIQDGLVAMWDGIENAGWGEHDDNASVWVGLGPYGFNLQSSGDIICTSNAWSFTSTGNIGRMQGINPPAQYSFKIRTVSACINIKRTSNMAILFLGIDVRPAGSKSMGLYVQKFLLTGWSNTPKYELGSSMLGYSTFDVLYQNENTSSAAFRNCQELVKPSVTEGFGDSAAIQYGLVVGDRSGNASWKLIGDVYCIRLYSRQLTTEEIAYNYSIDKARFNLP